MRKIKVDLKCRVPSWNYCNYDGPTADQRYSKELCRFCVSTKKGNYCSLHDTQLMADKNFVHKTPDCIRSTAGFAISIDEPVPEFNVDPKLIVASAIKSYNKTLAELLKQGYPRNLAETLAMQYTIGDN